MPYQRSYVSNLGGFFHTHVASSFKDFKRGMQGEDAKDFPSEIMRMDRRPVYIQVACREADPGHCWSPFSAVL